MIDSFMFGDRQEAGTLLGQRIVEELANCSPLLRESGVVLYALPRGGVQVAEPIAQRLGCPIEVLVAKKITPADNSELAIGAVTATGQVMRGRRLPHMRDVAGWRTAQQLAAAKAQAQWQQLAPLCPQTNPAGKIALIIDDGIATGMTMAIAARTLRLQGAAQVWLCAPVAPRRVVQMLHAWSDRTIVLLTPERFSSVSRFYDDFSQVEMESAIACLQHHNGSPPFTPTLESADTGQ